MANVDPNVQTRERAYYIWERDGRAEGRALDHWLQAQAELATEARPGPGARRVTRSAARPCRPPAQPSGAEEAAAGRKPARRRSKPKKRS